MPLGVDKDKWCTPRWCLDPIYTFFGGEIDLDPCSGEGSIVKANHTYNEATDGLAQDWSEYKSIFANPPYSRPNLANWSAKCARYGNQDAWETEILLLVPNYSSAAWFQENVFPTCTSILFYNKRISFKFPVEEPRLKHEKRPKAGSPTFHSVLVYWGQRVRDFEVTFSPFGWCISP